MERLENVTLADRTALTPTSICHLTGLCLRSTYFAFQGNIFQQKKGTAMGSPEQLSFLDVFIRRNHNTLETKVYQKPTHTHQYLNFKSHHHPCIKFGVVQCLTKQAIAIYLPEELDLLKDVFVANGYPEKKVNELIKNFSTDKKEV